MAKYKQGCIVGYTGKFIGGKSTSVYVKKNEMGVWEAPLFKITCLWRIKKLKA